MTASSATPTTAPDTPAADSSRCKFFLQRKRRFCAAPPAPGHEYCGNHLHEVTGSGEARVPCPANPNHHVPISQLVAHLPKCTDALHKAALRAQPYFSENLNAGADATYSRQQQQQQQPGQHATATAAAAAGAFLGYSDTPEVAMAVALAAAAAAVGLIPSGPQAAAVAAVAAEAGRPFLKGTAAARQAAAVGLGPEGFQALLAKIDAAHAALTAAHPLTSRKLRGPADAAGLQQQCKAFDKLMPFDAKHALQNASIVGNLAKAGLLRQPGSSVFVELGAGKAWLSAWLHMLHPGSSEFVLLDRIANFSNKADRRLRHLNVTRVAVDLKDAALLPLLQLHMSPPLTAATAVAAGDGGSSDGCTGGSNGSSSRAAGGSDGQEQGAVIINRGGLVRLPKRARTVVQPAAATAAAAAAAATAAAAPAAGDGPVTDAADVAANAGDDAEEQQQQQQQSVTPWVVTGKHLCGAATDFALRACYNMLSQQQQQQQQQQQFDLQGLAIASCCHHRCGWLSYTGKAALQEAAGISREDFEVIAWLTGWALCGHDAAPGTAQAGADDDGGGDGNLGNPAAGTAAAAAGCRQAGHDCSCDNVQQQGQQRRRRGAGAEPAGWHPADSLSHQQRVQLGLKCKQLIDAGRCAWLQQQLAPLMEQMSQQQQGEKGMSVAAAEGGGSGRLRVQRVAYIDETISGENTLLLLGQGAG